MWSIISMVLLKFTSIGFPGKIKIIDSLNHKIVLVRRNVSMMGVVSPVRFSLESLSLGSDSWAQHEVGIVSWSVSSRRRITLNNRVISLCVLSTCLNRVNILAFSSLCSGDIRSLNFSNLGLCNFNLLTWYGFICFDLISIKALSSVILHSASITTSLLNKTNHCFVTGWIETSVISSSKSLCKMIVSLSYSINTKITFNIVSEISHESSSIFQFNSHCLIVNRWPGTINFSTSSFGSDGFVSILEIKVPGFLLSKFKLMIWILDLNFVWNGVSAEFFGFE